MSLGNLCSLTLLMLSWPPSSSWVSPPLTRCTLVFFPDIFSLLSHDWKSSFLTFHFPFWKLSLYCQNKFGENESKRKKTVSLAMGKLQFLLYRASAQHHPSIVKRDLLWSRQKHLSFWSCILWVPASCSLTQWGKTVIDGWYQRILLFVKILHHLSTVDTYRERVQSG